MKRANGTGGVVKLSGTRRRPYVVRVSGRDRYGHIIQRPLSYHATAREAQDALDAYNRAKEAGTAPQPDKLSMTVGQVFQAWSEREYRKLSSASITSHNAAWSKRVSRYKDRKIREVTLDDWQAILDEDEDQGRSQSLINNDAILIKALCAFAMKRDIIAKDYSEYLDIPSVGAKVAKGALTETQLAKVEQMAKDGVPWADTVLMLCYTGFRVSEFLALTRFSYDEKENCLRGGMKTDAGKNRTVPVHPKIKPYLLQWISKGGQTIICKNDGSPISGDAYRKCFAQIMSRIDLPDATPHWCRHTFATRLHLAGADPLAIKWLMGHSTPDITEHYTHKTLGALNGAIRLLA